MLGLDLGERRIGVAISTPEGGLAVPLRIIVRESDEQAIEAIAQLAREERVEALVVGYPRSLDGSVGPQARLVESFAQRAGEACALPVELQDERLTSKQAERAAPGAKKRKGPSDDIAAAIILQAFLDRAGTNRATGT